MFLFVKFKTPSGEFPSYPSSFLISLSLKQKKTKHSIHAGLIPLKAMGDVVTYAEVWSTDGIVHVLMTYPGLKTFFILMLVKIALGTVLGNNFCEHKVSFNTKTKHARSSIESKGRRFAEAFSLQTIDGWIRRKVVPRGSFEVDIANCYPSILCGLTKGRVKTPWLTGYITNRQSCIEEICKTLGVKHDIAKELVLVVLNGFSWRFRLAKLKGCDIQSVGVCRFLDGLQTEMKDIRQFVKGSTEFKSLKSKIRTEKPGEQEERYDTLAFSILLEQKERAILDHLIQSSRIHFGFEVNTILHDGFIVSRATIEGDMIQNGTKVFNVSFVESVLSEKAANDFGFDIRVKIKPISTNDLDDEIPRGQRQPHFTNIIKKRERFVDMPVFQDGERCIAIKAGMKAGKTTAMKKFLETSVSSKERVLLTTGRIQQALSLVGGLSHVDYETGERVSSINANDGQPFKIYFYRDKEESLSLDRPGLYICQWESLHCLLSSDENKYRTFDYMICDEIRSTLSQSCVAVTNKSFLRTNMYLFRNICKQTRCLFFDADLLIDEMVERFSLAELGGVWEQEQVRVELYTFQSMPRNLGITKDQKLFVDALKLKIEQARTHRLNGGGSSPVFVACRSKRGMADLLQLLTGEAAPEFLKDNIAYFSSASSSQQMAYWEDIDRFLRDNDVDLMLTTSKVTVCADMQTRITACFILANSNGGCYVRDLFQTIGRARNPVSETILTIVNDPNTKAFDIKDPDFSDVRKSLLEDARLRREYLNLIQMETGFDIEDSNGFNKLVLHQSPDWMLNLVCDSEIESQRNKMHMFHVTLLRTAVYKGWQPMFVKGDDDSDDDEDPKPLNKAHKAAGDDIDKRADSLLSQLKSLTQDELAIMAGTKADGGLEKEKASVAHFLLQFPDFIPHITLSMRKYYQNNAAVFDRVKALEMDKESLNSVDVKRLVKASGHGIPERAALIFPAIDKFCDLFMKVLKLDFETDIIKAPVEEPNPKKRDIDNYSLDKDALADLLPEVSRLTYEILRNQAKVKTMRVKTYSNKNRGLGVIRSMDEILKLFGRKTEACKDRSTEKRFYRIVQDEDFFMLNPHYKSKEYMTWARDASIKEVIRKAKAENPSLLRGDRYVDVVASVKAGATCVNKKKRKPDQANNKKKTKQRVGERIDVPDYVPFPPIQHFIEKANEDEDATRTLLSLLDDTPDSD